MDVNNSLMSVTNRPEAEKRIVLGVTKRTEKIFILMQFSQKGKNI